MERLRRRRTAPRLAGLLACAVVPAMVTAGCSSGPGDGSGGSDSGATTGTGKTAGATAAPAVAPATYATLPLSCRTVTRSTVTALVPKARTAGGTESKSSDIQSRGGCSWTGNGKDGYQYRWLSVTLQRFDNSAQLGSAQTQAKERYADQVRQLGKVPGATTAEVAGIGDEAASVGARATVAKVTSQNATLVTRTGNVILIVEFNGAGLEGKKNPSAQTVQSGAQRAAKDVVAAVAAANT
jgi:hypothetical protein